LVTIAKGVDVIHDTAELDDGVATIFVVVVNITVQPNEKDILHHFDVGPSMSTCIF
jgi:hypothetical protein